MIRLSDLRRLPVRDADGRKVGRVHEVLSDKGRIVALLCGPSSLIARWTDRTAGKRLPWSAIDRIDRKEVRLKPEPSADR